MSGNTFIRKLANENDEQSYFSEKVKTKNFFICLHVQWDEIHM